MKKKLFAAMVAVSAIAPFSPVSATDQKQVPQVVCTGRHPTKPGFICSDGTKTSLDGVEVLEAGKTPKFDVSRKLLKVATQLELQQCENNSRYTRCRDKPWDDIDFISVENEAECINKGRFIAFEKWQRASRQGFSPTITWSCI